MKEQQMRDQNTIVQRPPGVDIIKGLVDMNLLAGGKQRKRDYDGKFDGRIPEGCFHYEYSEETLKDILTQQQLMVDFLKKHDKTKHWANRILILFDDLVGSSLFSNARQNTFKMLNTNHRHLSTSLIMVSQAFKEIPKTVRTQFSALVLFEIYSDGEIEAIYNEFPMGMKKDTWLEAYRYCVADEYAFMYYNIQREKALRVMKKFQQVLSVKEDPNIPEPKRRKTK